jgi:hypothetical protein
MSKMAEASLRYNGFKKAQKNLLRTRRRSRGEHTVSADPDAIDHDGSLKNGTRVYFTPTKKNRKLNGGLTSQHWPRTIVRCVMPIQAWNSVDATNWAQIQNLCSSAAPELIKTTFSSTWQQNIFLKCSETCLNYPFSTTWAMLFVSVYVVN